MADNDVSAVDVSTITATQPDIGEAGIEMPSQKRKRRVPKPFTPSARVNAAKSLVEKATRQKKTKKTVRTIQPRVSPGKTPSPVQAGPSEANLDSYVIPKKRQATPVSSDDSDSDTPPPPKRSQKARALHHEDLVDLLSSFKEGILNEVDGRLKQRQQQPNEDKEDRRWLKGIEHREFKGEAIKQQVKHNDAIFRLVAEARDDVERGGEKGKRNAEACLEAAESKINKRQKFLVAGQEFGFQIAESSFGEGAQDFSGAELQQIMQQQSMMAKIQTFKVTKGTG